MSCYLYQFHTKMEMLKGEAAQFYQFVSVLKALSLAAHSCLFSAPYKDVFILSWHLCFCLGKTSQVIFSDIRAPMKMWYRCQQRTLSIFKPTQSEKSALEVYSWSTLQLNRRCTLMIHFQTEICVERCVTEMYTLFHTLTIRCARRVYTAIELYTSVRYWHLSKLHGGLILIISRDDKSIN